MDLYTLTSNSEYGPTLVVWVLAISLGGMVALFLMAAALRVSATIRDGFQNRLNIEYNQGVTDTTAHLKKTVDESYWLGFEKASIAYYGRGFAHGHTHGDRNGFHRGYGQGHEMGRIDQSIFLLEKYANRD